MRFPTAQIPAALAFFCAASLTGCGNGSAPALPSAVQNPVSSTMASARTFQAIPLITDNVLHNFTGYSTDGQFPVASLLNVNGTLYGTTVSGGAVGDDGTIFSITPAGAVTILHSFGASSGPDGNSPQGNLIDVGGTLYGTTFYGGANGYGCVYSFDIATGVEKVVYSFLGAAENDGEFPLGGLVNIAGVLYGTTQQGGMDGIGTVYSLTRHGAETNLHIFTGDADGGEPEAGLVNDGGVLYGTTGYGGANGTGTVFSITTGGSKTVVYNFAYTGDAKYPYAPLIDVAGTLYGTTEGGGANNDGAVYSISGGGEKIVYSFAGGVSDGEFPLAGLLYLNGNLFGTTSRGGPGSVGDGTVFKLTPAGKETVLHFFTGQPGDGDYPLAGLIKYKTLLYGVTRLGGTDNYGTVFSITP